MNNRRTKPLIPLCGGAWARGSLLLLLCSLVAVGARAQSPQGWNSELRTGTWSVYGQGGLSWATGVWYENIDAKRSYKLSPAVGGGVDFTIRPWVRVGAEYLWSRYRREQRFSKLETTTGPMKAYGNYLMNYHNAKLGVAFNFMELWPRRRAQWLNIWVGTGFGYTFAKGNEYDIRFSTTKTEHGETVPLTGGETVGNESTVTITGQVCSANRHEHFNKPYIPASLHIEADVSRQFTVGVKGEADWLLNRGDLAPENLFLALATVRYNFVAGRSRALQRRYEGDVAALNERVNALQRENETMRRKAETDRAQWQSRNDELQRRLADCEQQRTAAPTAAVKTIAHYVQFAHNSATMSREETARLRDFARHVHGKKLSLVAEASTPGTDRYNQRLSERRLDVVVRALVRAGIAREDLHPQTAIGSQRGKPAAEGRRVTITVEREER
ncbi:MAG: hypothetical protein ACOYJK_02930 [Prevotella sp.]|jgi:outer membrane protein OmpA-like peptidoglycan-associated protein